MRRMAMTLASLRFQITAVPFIVLAFAMAATLVGMVEHARGRIAAENKSSTELVRAFAQSAVAEALRTDDPLVFLAGTEKRLLPFRHVRVVVSTSVPPLGALQPRLADMDVPEWFSRWMRVDFPVEVLQVASANRLYGYLALVPFPGDEIEEVWEDFRFLSVIGLIQTIAVVLTVWWVVARGLRPIRLLSSGLDQLGRGEFSTSLAPIAVPELRRIGEEFNSLAQSLDRTIHENRTLCARLMSLQESERRHLAHELHDELGPCLFGIRAEASHLARLAQDECAVEAKVVGTHASSIGELANSIQGINRRILETLRPVGVLADLGMKATLGDLVDSWKIRHPGTLWLLDVEDDESVIDEAVCLVVYRTVQESLVNVARHSSATRAEITVRIGNDIELPAVRNERTPTAPCAPPGVRLLIWDNGCGVPPTPRRGLGLLGMAERIRGCGGWVDVYNAPQGGATVDAFIPLAPERRETS